MCYEVAVVEVPEFTTVVEFLAWDGPSWQLHDGVPEAMAPASGTHAMMQSGDGALHFAANRPGCLALTNPGVVPRVNSEYTFRIADLGAACAPIPRDVIEITEPIVLIEILLPANSTQTSTNAWAYASIPSVREILVIRTASIDVQLLRRAPDSSWPDVPLAIEAGELTLESIGFRSH